MSHVSRVLRRLPLLLLGALLLVPLGASLGSAEEEATKEEAAQEEAARKEAEGARETASIDPETLARLILEDDGPEQLLVAQALRHADVPTLAAVQAALRTLAPVIVQEAAARGPVPDRKAVGEGPQHLVTLEVRFLETDEGLLRDISSPSSSLVSGAGGGLTVQYLDDTEVEVILRAVEKSERIRQITAPRITVYDRQRANVSVLNQKSVVTDLEAVDLGEGVLAARPVSEIFQEGVVVNVRPTLSQDRRYVTVELSMLTATLAEPAARKTISVAGKTIEVAVPTTVLQPARTTVRLPDGGTFLMHGAFPGKEESARLTLVRASVLTLESDEGKALADEVEREARKARERAGGGK